MNDPARDELLSAFLDGELTADEQARVARLLEDDPAARRRLDELRAVSQAVQGLPRLSLGEDLADEVLRLAERRILAGPSEVKSTVSPVKPAGTSESVWRTVGRRLRKPRTLAWSGAAVAVAILATLFNPEVNAPRNAPKDAGRIALKDDRWHGKHEPTACEPPACEPKLEPAAEEYELAAKHWDVSGDRKHEEERKSALPGKARSPRKPHDVAKSEKATTPLPYFPAEKAAPSDGGLVHAPAAVPSGALAVAPLPGAVARPLDERVAGKTTGTVPEHMTKKLEAKPDRVALESLAKEDKRASKKPDDQEDSKARLADAAESGRQSGKEGEKSAWTPTRPSLAIPAPNAVAGLAGSQAKGGGAMKGGGGMMGGMGMSGAADSKANENWGRHAKAGPAGAPSRALASESPVLIVHCEITPEAVQQGRFAEVLSRNQIQFTHDMVSNSWTPPPVVSFQSLAKQQAAAVQRQQAILREGQARLHQRQSKAAGGQAFDRPTETGQRSDTSSANNAWGVVQNRGNRVEEVLVEATWDQIEGTLDELEQRPNVFLSVAAQPTPGVPVLVPRPIEQYNRGRERPARANSPRVNQRFSQMNRNAAPLQQQVAQGGFRGQAQRLPIGVWNFEGTAEQPPLGSSAGLAQETRPLGPYDPYPAATAPPSGMTQGQKANDGLRSLPASPGAPPSSYSPASPPNAQNPSSSLSSPQLAGQAESSIRPLDQPSFGAPPSAGPVVIGKTSSAPYGTGQPQIGGSPQSGEAQAQLPDMQNRFGYQSTMGQVAQTAPVQPQAVLPNEPPVYRVLFLLDVVSPSRAAAARAADAHIQAAPPANAATAPASPPPAPSK